MADFTTKAADIHEGAQVVNEKMSASPGIQLLTPAQVLQKEKEEIKSKLLDVYDALQDSEEKGEEEEEAEERRQGLTQMWQQLVVNFAACQKEHMQHITDPADLKKFKSERTYRWFQVSDALEFFIETARQNIADLEKELSSKDQRSKRLLFFSLAISGVVLDFFAPEQQEEKCDSKELSRFHEDELVCFLADMLKSFEFLSRNTNSFQVNARETNLRKLSVVDEYAVLADALKEHIAPLGMPTNPSVLQILEYAPESEGGTLAEETLSPREVRSPRNAKRKKKKSVSFSMTHLKYSEEKAMAQSHNSNNTRSTARELDMRLLPTQIYFNSDGLLGCGTFGEVYCGCLTKDREGRIQVAIKVAHEDELMQECLLEAAAVMAKISSSAATATSVIEYFGAGYLNVPGEPVFTVTALVPCSLRSIIRNIEELNAFELRIGTRFHLAAKLKLLIQVIDAVIALHNLDIIHSNLKPENVLLTADGTAKLTDVGLALPIDTFRASVLEGNAAVESIFYSDPELLADASAVYDTTTDIYSFAVIANEVLGELPRIFDVTQDQINLLTRRNFRPKLFQSDGFDRNERRHVGTLQFLIRSMWDADCDRRPPMTRIYSQFMDILREVQSAGDAPTIATPGSNEKSSVSTSSPGVAKSLHASDLPPGAWVDRGGNVSASSSDRSSGIFTELQTAGIAGFQQQQDRKPLENLSEIEVRNFLENLDLVGFIQSNKRDAFFEARLTGKNLKKICDANDPHAVLQQLNVLAIKADDFLSALIEHQLNGVPSHLLVPDGKMNDDAASDFSISVKSSLNDSTHSISTKGLPEEYSIERRMELLYRKVRYGPSSFSEYQELVTVAKQCEDHRSNVDHDLVVEGQIAASFLACLFVEANATIREKDFEQARKYAKMAQSWLDLNEKHNFYAMTNLAVCHQHNLFCQMTRADVYSLFLRAVQSQRIYQRAACYLGECFEFGIGTAKDVSKARKLYERFTSPGKSFPHSLFLLGKSLLSSEKREDKQAAFKHLLAAASKDHIEAKYFLGLCYFYGYGTEVDLEAAKHTFKNEHVQKLKARALVMLGNCYCDRQRAMKKFTGDRKKAFKAFETAASAGLAEGIYCLGLCHWDGTGTQQSYSKAYEKFRQAAELQYKDAFLSLYHCYLNGRGVTVDQSKADECLIEGARLGSKDARKLCDTMNLNYK